MDILRQLPARVTAVETELAALRGEFASFRTEVRDEFASVRNEIREGNEETRTQMRVLHEDVISRLALLQEGRRKSNRRHQMRLSGRLDLN